tara:strand:+ start:113 stop:436 length:324 start_codon:yes stop_codon:yes gene_type:complete
MAPYAFEDDAKRRYPSSSALSREISFDELEDDFLLFPFLLVISPPFPPPYPYPLLLSTLLSLETTLLCRRRLNRLLNRRDFDAQMMKRERKRERESALFFCGGGGSF